MPKQVENTGIGKKNHLEYCTMSTITSVPICRKAKTRGSTIPTTKYRKLTACLPIYYCTKKVDRT